MIRPVDLSDAAAIAALYNHYVRETAITFEETPLTEPQVAERISCISADFPWLVAEEQGRLLGFAYAAPWKNRSAFRFTVEASIYLASAAQGKGLGTGLYRQLFALLQRQGVHTVIAGISLPNPASIALHEKLGFTKCGHFARVGFKFGRRIDVGYWQLLLGDNRAVPPSS